MSSKAAEIQSDLNGIIEKLLSNGKNKSKVQHKYILPPHERPQMSEVSCYSENIPVVDLKDLDGPKRSSVVEEIRSACKDGFFQIVNHGVPETVMKSMMEIAKEFFEMPVEDRACLYSEDPNQRVRLSTSFNVRTENFYSWREYLTHPCHPLEEVMGSWPEKPAGYRGIASKYATEVRALVLRLLASISEALGLSSDYLNSIFGKHHQGMAVNYYPLCPNPDLTLGLRGHLDGNGITVLMQGDVNGLQVLKDGKWVSVEPIANAFVINLGDQLQVVSNGRFRSVEHRVLTNASTTRISVPTFYSPSQDAFISPAASLVDEQHPALYRGYQFGEFTRVYWGQELKGKSSLEHFKIQYPKLVNEF